jgi:hypothetical protein
MLGHSHKWLSLPGIYYCVGGKNVVVVISPTQIMEYENI